MKVDIQIECTTESLNQGDRAGPGLSADATRLLNQVGFDRPLGDAEHPAHHLGPAGEQKTELKRKAQHPLSHRQPGQYLVHQ